MPSYPITIPHAMGGKIPGDIIWTTYPPISPIVSDKVIRILNNEGFTGWSTYPVNVYYKSGEIVPGYQGLSITGRCGQIDWSKSRKEPRPPRVPKGKPFEVYIGMFFEPSTWEGSEIFCPEGRSTIFVLEHVMKSLKKNKVKNLLFHKSSEYERDDIVVDSLKKR